MINLNKLVKMYKQALAIKDRVAIEALATEYRQQYKDIC
jgi:hypothetical protein